MTCAEVLLAYYRSSNHRLAIAKDERGYTVFGPGAGLAIYEPYLTTPLVNDGLLEHVKTPYPVGTLLALSPKGLKLCEVLFGPMT